MKYRYNDVVKRTANDKLVKKLNTTDSDKNNLEKKIEHVDKKILDTTKFVVTQEFNCVNNRSIDKMAEASKKLVTKNKQLIQEIKIEKNFKNFKRSSYFIGKSDFDDDASKNYFILQPVSCGTIDKIGWKSKELLEESIIR